MTTHPIPACSRILACVGYLPRADFRASYSRHHYKRRILAKSLPLAFLIGAVTACVVQVGNLNTIGVHNRIERERVAVEQNLPAVPCDMLRRARQSIVVSTEAVDEKEFRSILNIKNILWRECSRTGPWGLPCWRDHLWTQKASAQKSRIKSSQIETVWENYIAEKAIGIELKVLRSSLATVLPYGRNAPIKMSRGDVWLIEPANAARKYESAFIGNEGFSGQFSLSTSRNPQSASERGNDDSGERRNGAIVGVYKFAAAKDIRTHDGDAGGYIIFGGGILTGLFVLLYAALKDWRERAFDKKKYQQKREDKR